MADHREEALVRYGNGQNWVRFLRSLTPSVQEGIRSVQTFDGFSKFLNDNSIPAPEGPLQLWQAREDYLTYGAPPPSQEGGEDAKQDVKKKRAKHVPAHIAHGEEAPTSPEDLEKKANKFADRAEKEWHRKPDPQKAMDSTHAWSLGKQAYYDRFAEGNLELAQDWSRAKKDPFLETAIERKVLLDEARNRKQPQPNFNWKPSYASSVHVPERNTARSLISDLGRNARNASSIATRGGDSLIRSLFRLMLRSMISAVGAAVGAVASAIGAAATALAAFITALTGISIATLIPILVILVVVIVIIVAAAVISFLFPPSQGLPPGQEYIESPYPGISYSIIASPESPQKAFIGSDIKYQIVLLHIPEKAGSITSDKITLISTFPTYGIEFVSATGNYTLGEGSIRWKLLDNSPFKEGEEKEDEEKESSGKVFLFELVLRATDEITIENNIQLQIE